MAGTKSLGLLGMKERAGLLGGKMEIAGAPGKGTRVSVTIPIAPGRSASQ
jgi:signal transduction histidine kinase